MLTKEQLKEFKEVGFLRISNYFDEKDFMEVEDFRVLVEDELYNEELLRKRISYLSDSTETRKSNAIMVSTGNSPLPHFGISNTDLGLLLEDFNMVVAQVSGSTVDEVHNTRTMLNFQSYENGSKPVPRHFDGEYLDFNKNEQNNSEVLTLSEVLAPEVVMIGTITNELKQGAKLKEIGSNTIFSPLSEPGDMLLINNTRFLHFVDELKGSRSMFGFRNMDYKPFWYRKEMNGRALPAHNDCFTGYVSRITTKAAEVLLYDFNQKWQKQYSNELVAKF